MARNKTNVSGNMGVRCATAGWMGALAVLGLGGCAPAMSTQIMVEERVVVEWAPAFNDQGDGLVAVVPIELYAYDQAGFPSAGIELSVVLSEADERAQGAWLAWPGQIEGLAGQMSAAADHAGGLVGWEAGSEVRVWDVTRDELVAIHPEADGLQGHLTGRTDEDGTVRFFVVVDAFDEELLGMEVHVVRTLSHGRSAFAEDSIRLEETAGAPAGLDLSGPRVVEGTVRLQPR